MSASIGQITARLVQPSEESAASYLIDLINANITPPTPVTAEDVYIAAMYVVSDEVNSFGGRFPSEEHERLAQLLIDSPVLAGHRKDKLPIGRNFHAEVVERAGQSWVKSYFYWLKSSTGAETVKTNIDGGIYKECSIAFTFLFPECSICGKDIRACGHQPFQAYAKSDSGNDGIAHFNYRQIERVLETSLVYRGAVPGTSVRRELISAEAPQLIESIEDFNLDDGCLIVPFYESLPTLVRTDGRRLQVQLSDGSTLPEEVTQRFIVRRLPKIEEAFAHLIGYRGRERCSIDQVRDYLSGKATPVTRLELKLFPPQGWILPRTASLDIPNRIGLIRHRVAAGNAIAASAQALATKQGVRLWSLRDDPVNHAGYVYRVHQSSVIAEESYTISMSGSDTDAILQLKSDGRVMSYRIRQFSTARLNNGGRFVTDPMDHLAPLLSDNGRRQMTGQLQQCERSGRGYKLTLTGALGGAFVLHPITLHGEERLLFYRINDSSAIMTGRQE